MNACDLPLQFVKNMRKLFSDFDMAEEFDSFMLSFSKEPVRGIRMNSLKIRDADEFEKILHQMYEEAGIACSYEKVPWSDDGYYIPAEFTPGRHFFYPAGLFYIQEPSAMLPANILDAKPGEHVLDLCAAPGGKTVKIAADMKGEGILISNDINETRVKALVRNVELAGCRNCIVLNESPENISRNLEGYFDKILIDAPCSGEGMFRRDPDAAVSWEKFGNDSCAKMQEDILSYVDNLLKPGGIIVYSTCTFTTRENEEMIGWFMANHPWYDVVPLERMESMDSGLTDNKSLQGSLRIFPHHAAGEGHFCVKLQKKYGHDPRQSVKFNTIKTKKDQIEFGIDDFIQAFRSFSMNVLTSECQDEIIKNSKKYLNIIKGHVYSLPEPIPSLDNLKIAKKGLYLGELKKTRDKILFEPSHSFLLSLTKDDLSNPVSFTADDLMLMKYFKGETIFHPDIVPGRHVTICVQGYPIGWGKGMDGDMIKNLYPKGWRMRRD